MIKIIATIIVFFLIPAKPNNQVDYDEVQDPLHISKKSPIGSRKPAMENFDSFKKDKVAKPKNNQ